MLIEEAKPREKGAHLRLQLPPEAVHLVRVVGVMTGASTSQILAAALQYVDKHVLVEKLAALPQRDTPNGLRTGAARKIRAYLAVRPHSTGRDIRDGADVSNVSMHLVQLERYEHINGTRQPGEPKRYALTDKGRKKLAEETA